MNAAMIPEVRVSQCIFSITSWREIRAVTERVINVMFATRVDFYFFFSFYKISFERTYWYH